MWARPPDAALAVDGLARLWGTDADEAGRRVFATFRALLAPHAGTAAITPRGADRSRATGEPTV